MDKTDGTCAIVTSISCCVYHPDSRYFPPKVAFFFFYKLQCRLGNLIHTNEQYTRRGYVVRYKKRIMKGTEKNIHIVIE